MAGGDVSDGDQVIVSEANRPDASQVPELARCRQCGYSLRGLTVNRCPECGVGFEPSDPGTMVFPRALEQRVADMAIGTATSLDRALAFLLPRSTRFRWPFLAALGTLQFLAWFMRGEAYRDAPLLAWTYFLVGWGLWVESVQQFRCMWRSRFALLLLLIPISLSVGFDSCPHGRYIALAPGSWAITVTGQRCGNQRFLHTVWHHFFGLRGPGNW
jgi:hypothetical protein